MPPSFSLQPIMSNVFSVITKTRILSMNYVITKAPREILFVQGMNNKCYTSIINYRKPRDLHHHSSCQKVENKQCKGNKSKFKMIRRQREHCGQNKIIHINGAKENLSFIIIHMILTQKKKLMTQTLCRGRL